MSGPAVAVAIRQRGLPTRVLALSAHSDEKYVRAMMDAGAIGYILKEEAPGAIVAAVQAAAKGEGWFSPSIARQIAAWAKGGPPRQPELSEREWAVLRLVARGKTNKEIALALSVAERTVEFHVGNILRKLGLNSRVEAALWAKEHEVST